jgi:sugar/nucleoside kinase (ribokinase family)
MSRPKHELVGRIVPHTFPNLVIYGHAGFDVSSVSGRLTKAPGGAAYYAALAASLVSRSIGIVTVLGEDFPISGLQSLNIDTSGVILQDGSSAIFYQEYGNDHEIKSLKLSLNVCDRLSPTLIPKHYMGTRFFFITTAPTSQQSHVIAWLIEQRFDGVIAIDTTTGYVRDFRSLLREYEDYIGIVFANEEEYRKLRWMPTSGTSLVVKRGSSGASLYEKEIWTDVPAPIIDR